MKQTAQKRSLALLLAIVMIFGMFPTMAMAAGDELKTEKPILVVTGSGMDTEYEKAYTLEELKALETTEVLYSAINSSKTKSLFLGEGITLETLLGGKLTATTKVVASDGYASEIDLTETRYYYPNFVTEDVSDAVEAKAIIAWAEGGSRGDTSIPTEAEDTGELQLMLGQTAVDDINNSSFIGDVVSVVTGDALPAIVKIANTDYTRAELLMMDRAERAYTYTTKKGEQNVYARGVAIKTLFDGYDNNDIIKFETVDDYPAGGTAISYADLVSGNAILAYETGASANDLEAIYKTVDEGTGYLTLYRDGQSPVQLVDTISVTISSGPDYVNSEYKHITDETNVYNIDAITGATLTIEGPAVTQSTPMSVRELEGENEGVVRGDYTDNRNGDTTERTYEGISLSYILNDIKGIDMTENAAKVLIKNRTRATIAEFTLEQIAEAEAANSPIIVAYGTSNTDETNIRPFVYTNAAGEDTTLGNGDGCLKLVYDKSAITGDINTDYTSFGNMAYIYVAEDDTPGYEHDKSPYNDAENTEFVFSVTGSEIGREINFTVAELEAMTKLIHQDEYSLANSTYWYVQEYKGVELWKLLCLSNLSENTDKDVVVSFRTSDNYDATEKFTIEELSDSSNFGYYEKNPADIDDDYVSTDDVPLDTGYPVLVAYGVNGYPYVADKDLDGYMSGLSNDGGPLRIIFGKRDYDHANGSLQAKYVNSAVVGDEVNYSTHKYNTAYSDLADNTLAIKVTGTEGDTLTNTTYTVGQIEDLIYGSTVTNAQITSAKIKDFYNSSKGYSDLYEGVSLEYFLTDIVGLAGSKGTITFTDSEGETLEISLETAFNIGSNASSGKTNLAPVIAFAKNGVPMVANKSSVGYESTYALSDTTEKAIKNAGGPLSILFPEYNGAKSAQTLENVVSIEIDLTPDNYAHTTGDYLPYASETIKISGEGTRITGEKTFTVAELEGLQKYAVTGDYNILTNGGKEYQVRYRGIDLYAFLSSDAVGLKTNSDVITIESSDGKTTELTLNELMADYINGQNSDINDLNVILAYGASSVTNEDAEDGKPLVTDENSAGYVADYINDDGPLMLVVGQTDASNANASKLVSDVVSITVSAAELASTKHNINAIYEQYGEDTIDITLSDSTGEIYNETFTVNEIEAMDSIIYSGEYTSTSTNIHDGLLIWELIQQTAGIDHSIDIEDVSLLKVTAGDDYSLDLLSKYGADVIEYGVLDGATRYPLILAYSQNGYPLVPSTSSEGYVGTALNDNGPLRLMTHNNQGTCISDIEKITIEIDGEVGTATSDTAIIVTSPLGETALDIKTIKGYEGSKAESSYSFTSEGTLTTDKVVGISLADLIKGFGIVGDNYTVELVTTDGFTGKGTYQNITAADVANMKYFVAYDANEEKIADADDGGNIAYVRVYRNYDDGSTWYNRVTNVSEIAITANTTFTEYLAGANGLPINGSRSIEVTDDGIWVGTYGGGAAYLANGASSFTVYDKTTNPALKSAYAVEIAADEDGGVWISQSGTYDNTGANPSCGAAYLKDGEITYYNTTKANTIPHDYVQEVDIDTDGNVWFGSWGGLTKYDVTAGAWTTWDKTDGFPSNYVDNIEFDAKGGVWVGFYPEFNGATFTAGGYAYLSADGKVTAYNAGDGETVDSSLLADFWVRDIAVDADGGAWIVRSGSYATLANIGGRVDYVAPDGTVTHLYGKDLLDLTATDTENVEIRTVTVDVNGGIWFGTSGDGIFYGSSAHDMATEFSAKSLHIKTEALCNIYSLDIVGDTLYITSNGGVATYDVSALVDTSGDTGSGGSGSGSVTEDVALTITGSGIKTEAEASLSEIKGMTSEIITADYTWENSYGTTGTSRLTGVKVSDIISEFADLTSGAESIKVIASDGYYRQFNFGSDDLGVDKEYMNGLYMIISWDSDGELTLIVPQETEGSVNKSSWVSDIVKIEVMSESVEAGSGSAGNYKPSANTETTEIKADDDGNIIVDIADIDGDIIISVPYEKTESEDANALVVYKVEDDGSLTLIPRVVYDEETSEIIFATKENGTYIVKENKKTFTDIETHWAEDYIEFLAARGIIDGIGDGKFDPDGIVTRAQFTKILAGIAGVDLEEYKTSSFADVDGYFVPYIEWASENGIVYGTGDGNFEPDEPISRDAMAVMVSRYLNLIGAEFGNINSSIKFEDDSDIKAIYDDAIYELYRAGIISGIETEAGLIYNPTGILTRAEACKVMTLVMEGLLK